VTGSRYGEDDDKVERHQMSSFPPNKKTVLSLSVNSLALDFPKSLIILSA
jgi:hypothetical protein